MMLSCWFRLPLQTYFSHGFKGEAKEIPDLHLFLTVSQVRVVNALDLSLLLDGVGSELHDAYM